MAEELQQLLEKIQRDGVDKANAEAADILARAKDEAAARVKRAEEDAAAVRAQAEKDARDFARRAEETVRQAARDTVLAVQEQVTALLTKLLADRVNAAAGDAALADAAAEAVRALVRGDESAAVAARAPLADALRARLAADAATAGVKVVTDDASAAGFTVKLENGRVEHDFTGPAVAAELARRLRPALAALVK